MTSDKLTIIYTVEELREAIKFHRGNGKKIGLVPTMGNLHQGHISLVKTAQQYADIIITSIFVNPSQFAANEDLSSYPRTLDSDAKMLTAAHSEILFLPNVESIYPDGFATTVNVAGLTDCLCGINRPQHFQGVATVVSKLLIQSMPDIAVFGEKDYQQLQVIRRLTKDLDIPVAIIGSKIWREKDGLAMSSRNGYLSDKMRAIAPVLNRAINQIAVKIYAGEKIAPLLAAGKKTILDTGVTSIDYLEIRNSDNLELIDDNNSDNIATGKARIFVAANLDKTRLLDNIKIDI